jgi:hypothetical protein
VGRNALIAVVAGALFVVAALAVLTPTVIVGDNDREVRSVRVMAPARPVPFPFRQGRLPDFRRCLQSHGFERGTPPSADKLRGALRDCIRPRLR